MPSRARPGGRSTTIAKAREIAFGEDSGILHTPKIHPKLKSVDRVITKNSAFLALVSNVDVFQSSYSDSNVVKSTIGEDYWPLVEQLQSRENGEVYHKQLEIEKIGDALVKTDERATTSLPTSNNEGFIEAFRPYLLLDKWISCGRKTPVDTSARKRFSLEQLHLQPKKGAKADAASKSLEKAKGALHKSFNLNLRTLLAATTTRSTSTSNGDDACPVSQSRIKAVSSDPTVLRNKPADSESSTVVPNQPSLLASQTASEPAGSKALCIQDSKVWNNLIKRGLRSQKENQSTTARYRLAMMTIVINFFIQGYFSDVYIHVKALKLHHSQMTQSVSLDADTEWEDMIQTGITWLNVALLTSVKDAILYPHLEAPSIPYLFGVANRSKQQEIVPGFMDLDNRLWAYLFKVATFEIDSEPESLNSYLLELGDAIDEERPEEHKQALVPYIKQNKGRFESVPPTKDPLTPNRSESGEPDPYVPELDSPGHKGKSPVTKSSDHDEGSSEKGEDLHSRATSAKRSSDSLLSHEDSRPQKRRRSGEPDPNVSGPTFNMEKRAREESPLTEISDHEQGSNKDNDPVRHPTKKRRLEIGPSKEKDSHTGDAVSAGVDRRVGGVGDGSNTRGKVGEESPLALQGTGRMQTRSHACPKVADLALSASDTGPELGGGREGQMSSVQETSGKGRKVQTDANRAKVAQLAASTTQAGSRRKRQPAQKVPTMGGVFKFMKMEVGEDDPIPKIKDEHEDRTSVEARNEGGAGEMKEDDGGVKKRSGETSARGNTSSQPSDESMAMDIGNGEEHETGKGRGKKKRGKNNEQEKKKKQEKNKERPKKLEDTPCPYPELHKIVEMNIDGQALKIDTWHEGDYEQLVKLKQHFGDKTSRPELEHIVYVTPWSQFADKDSQELGEILEKRHILVTGCSLPIATKQIERALGMKRSIEIQDTWYRDWGQISAHCDGTLQDMKDIMDRKGSVRPLNALDLPGGHLPLDIPRLSDLSFRDAVWQLLRKVQRPTFQESIPMDEVRWVLCSSRNAYSAPHIDSNGFCTVIAPVDSQKLWIVGRPKTMTLMDSRVFSSFGMYNVADNDDYEWAPLLLKPGDILYMKPGTVHAVVTIEPGFTVGEHFYTTPTLEESLVSMMHLCSSHHFLTNAGHDQAVAKTMIRLLHCWRMDLTDELKGDDVPKLNFQSPRDLRCLVMLGTYIHICAFVENHERGHSTADIHQFEIAVKDYVDIYQHFLHNYTIKGLQYKNFKFPEDDGDSIQNEAAEIDPGRLLEMVFKNGEMWCIAHVLVYLDQNLAACREEDDPDQDIIDALEDTRGDLVKSIDQMLAKYKRDWLWFDRVTQWVSGHMAKERLNEWVKWEGVEIILKKV